MPDHQSFRVTYLHTQELQQEIRKYQHQVQALEERLRFYKLKSQPTISLLQTTILRISDITNGALFVCFRMFEPDPVALASMNEVEATEKFLMETFTRVEERKVSSSTSRSITNSRAGK